MRRPTVTKVAVCVPSHRRPEQLDLLLDAIAGLDTDGIDLVVIVVDNDPNQTAAPVIDRHRSADALRIISGHETTPGYVGVRNHLMRLVPEETDWIAMIDDDSVPASPQWLQQLLSTARASEAAMVCGPVLPVMVDGSTESSAALLSHASVAFDGGPAGSPMRYGWTGNLLVRRAIVGPHPFDERFALTGAEDAEFTMRRTRDGHSLVWAPDAVVETWTSPERLEPQRMIELRRGDSAGLAWAYRAVYERMPAVVALRSVARLIESTASRVIARAIGDDNRRFAARMRRAGAIGMLRTGVLGQPPPRRIALGEWSPSPSSHLGCS